MQKLLFGALLLTVNHHHHHHQRTSISLSERDTQDENKVYWCKGPSLQGLYFQQFNSMQFKWRQCNSSRADNKRKRQKEEKEHIIPDANRQSYELLLYSCSAAKT